jgi:membrane protein YdbS with pleckstrin-like domain
MPTPPRDSFRGQAVAALTGFLAVAAGLLREVATGTAVRTEGDRVLVTVCTIGAVVLVAAVVALVVGSLIRRRRALAAQRPAEGPSVPDRGAERP